VLFQPHARRHVEQADDADGGVDQHAADIGERLARLALDQVVEADPEIRDVGEEIGYPGLYRRGVM
jgi:hypothetical protein